jgi:branched-subunit amino acid ABC-type transport system permease component
VSSRTNPGAYAVRAYRLAAGAVKSPRRFVYNTGYAHDHLDQVLATFGLILFFNEMVRILGWAGALRVAADVQLRHLGVARGGGTP